MRVQERALKAFESIVMTEVVEQVLKCPSCGAPLTVELGTTILTCKYCGSDSKVAGDKKFFLKHSLITSRYRKEDVEGLVKGWMNSGFYKPEDLGRKSSIMSMECILLPFFIVEASVSSQYSGYLTRMGGRIEKKGDLTKEYFWKVLARREIEFPTREYHIPLTGKAQFNISLLPPNSRFLNAELDEEEAKKLAEEELKANQESLLSEELDVIVSIKTDVEIRNVEFIHAPVWFIKYEYKGKLYDLLIYGGRGETITAEVPPPDTSLFGFLR